MTTRNRVKSNEDITATTTPTEEQSIVVTRPDYADDTLRAINSFEDAITAGGYAFGNVVDAADELGNGFTLLSTPDAKMELVGKPMMILEWAFHLSEEFGGEFVSLMVVVQEKNGSVSKYIVNDGSTGIYSMLADYTRRTQRQGGMMVRRGFRESTYPFCDDCRTAVRSTHAEDEPGHKIGRARTFYLDASK